MARMEPAATTSTAFLLLLVAACAAGQKQLALEECKGSNDTATFKSVTISPCDSEPCSIKRGESYNISFSAESNEETEGKRLVMVTSSLTQSTNTTDIKLTNMKSCFLTGTPCKLTKGQAFEGSIELRPTFLAPGEASYLLSVSAGRINIACGQTTLQVVGKTESSTQESETPETTN